VPTPSPSQHPSLRTAGLAAAVGGSVSIVVGGLLGAIAKGKYNDAIVRCADGSRGCPADAVAQANGAYDIAAASTVAVIAGAALLVGGVTMLVIAQNARPRIASTSPRFAVGPAGIAGNW
jgi:hypothetical protein